MKSYHVGFLERHYIPTEMDLDFPRLHMLLQLLKYSYFNFKIFFRKSVGSFLELYNTRIIFISRYVSREVLMASYLYVLQYLCSQRWTNSFISIS